MATLRKDLSGMRFGLLNVLRRTDEACKYTTFLCACACGNETAVRSRHLLSGATTSCGCIRRKCNSVFKIKHGVSHLPEYKIWVSMLSRCNNKDDKRYGSYGGRGIGICSRWLDVENFISDMGSRPSPKHSIDRIDNDGNYSPENCRWATREEQARNKRNSIVIEIDGARIPLADATGMTGVKYATALWRLHQGWPTSKILEK